MTETVTSTNEAWFTDPATLREVVLDSTALLDRLASCPDIERVWILVLLGRCDEAMAEGEALLARSSKRLNPLLVLACAYRGQYRWHEARRLQEEALRLAATPAREAAVRYQIGRRLFEEALYADAAAEFEWARDLYRTARRPWSEIEASENAMIRARELATRSHRENSTTSSALP
ncbi:tetratricopeptide (TPR) repeat protein [Arthrobacter sp. 2762]